VPSPILAAVSSLLFLPAPVDAHGDLFSLNVPLWTLSFELLVNLVYALTFRWLTTRVLGTVAMLGAVAMIAVSVAHGTFDVGAEVGMAVGGLGRSIWGFSAGILICRLAPRLSAAPLGLTLLLVVAALCVPLPPNLRLLYDIAFALTGAPLLGGSAARLEPQGVMLRFAKFLGAISFPLYAIHQPVLLAAIAVSYFTDTSELLVGAFTIVLLLVASYVLADRYDRPAREHLSKLFRRDSPA